MRKGIVLATLLSVAAGPAWAQVEDAVPKVVVDLPFLASAGQRVMTRGPGIKSHMGELHNAYDFGLPFLTPVAAVYPGEVVLVTRVAQNGDSDTGGSVPFDANNVALPPRGDPSGGAGRVGNLIVLKHDYTDGEGADAVDKTFYTMYAHLDGPGTRVAPGESVEAGQVIGRVGRTGFRQGDHLHFQFGTRVLEYGGSTQQFFGLTTIADATKDTLGHDSNGAPISARDFLHFRYRNEVDGEVQTDWLGSGENVVSLLPGEGEDQGPPPVSIDKALAELAGSAARDFPVKLNGVKFDSVSAASRNHFAELLLQHYIGDDVRNGSVKFSGSGEAAFLVNALFDVFANGTTTADREAFLAALSDAGLRGLGEGFLLTTGAYPDALNDEDGSSRDLGKPGDSDLDITAQTAFQGAGATQDAVSIEFVYDKTSDDVNSILFEVVFGSEEYPEFSSSSFVDIAAIYVKSSNTVVDGEPTFKNFAFFPVLGSDDLDETRPLSVIDENLENYFIDNRGGIFPIEWDGVSRLLTVKVPLADGENTIKFGIADTGDGVLDSGLYIHDIKLLAEDGETDGGVSNVIKDDADSPIVDVSPVRDRVELADDANVVVGTPDEFHRDTIVNFGNDDLLRIVGVLLQIQDFLLSQGSLILDIDTDGSGEPDTQITLQGEFEDAMLSLEQDNGDTLVSVTVPNGENMPPVAADDAFTVDEDAPLAGNVLADNGAGADADADGDPLSVSLMFGPAFGELELEPNGDFVFYADDDEFDVSTPGDTFEVTFAYGLSDGNGGESVGTANISVDILDDGVTKRRGRGRQTIRGTDGGEDRLFGGRDRDRIFGLDGADELRGGAGPDFLIGGESRDRLFGGPDADYLDGGTGDDFLKGGPGSDIFALRRDAGVDTIADFGAPWDRIFLHGIRFDELTFVQEGRHTALLVGGERLANLRDVRVENLDASRFRELP